MGRIALTLAVATTLTACGGCRSGTPSATANDEQAEVREHHLPHGDAPGGEAPEGGHHRFEDAERWAAQFESDARDEWQRPELVLELLELTEDMVVADIGSATGYFPVRFAGAAPEGRVWGVDIEPSMVRYLNERARSEGLDNLFSILGTAADPLLPEPVDLVVIVNTYHHVADRVAYFRRLRGELRPGGRLAVIDFRRGELPVGPDDEMKLSPGQVRRELEAAGYRLLETDTESLPYQYLLVFAGDAGALPSP